MRPWKLAIYAILALLLGAEAVVLAAIWKRGQNKDQNRVELTHGIEKLISLKTSNIEQFFIIRGDLLKIKPVVIYLHRGPGSPALPDVRRIGRETGLEQDALMVYWEPRGAGRSWTSDQLKVNPTVDDYVKDVCALAVHFQQEFERNGVVLAGSNFGGYLALRAAKQCSEPLLGVVAIDPWLKNTPIGPLEGHSRQRANWSFPQRIWWLATTPEYDWVQTREILQRGNPTADRMATSLASIDLANEVPELKTPTMLLHAIEDPLVPRAEIQKYFDALKAPDKQLVWIDNAGHEAILDAPATVGQAIRTRFEKWMSPPPPVDLKPLIEFNEKNKPAGR